MHIVVEAVFDGGPVAEVASVHAFHGLTEDVGRGMPEYGLKMSKELGKDDMYSGDLNVSNLNYFKLFDS